MGAHAPAGPGCSPDCETGGALPGSVLTEREDADAQNVRASFEARRPHEDDLVAVRAGDLESVHAHTAAGDGTSEDIVSCRMCLGGLADSDEPLCTLRCSCKGGLSAVHRSCADRWFASKGDGVCELCQQPGWKLSDGLQYAPVTRAAGSSPSQERRDEQRIAMMVGDMAVGGKIYLTNVAVATGLLLGLLMDVAVSLEKATLPVRDIHWIAAMLFGFSLMGVFRRHLLLYMSRNYTSAVHCGAVSFGYVIVLGLTTIFVHFTILGEGSSE